MKARINFKGGGSVDQGPAEIRNIIIIVNGSKFTITYSNVYGVVLNKIAIDDSGEDQLNVSPRTSNEIQLK